jgi:dolichol kinase
MLTEIKRKLVHAGGILTIFLIMWMGKWHASLIILIVALSFLVVGEYRKNKAKYKIVKLKKLDELEESMEGIFREHERPNNLPFKGTIEFFFGCFLATFIFEPRVAMASIAVLSLADAISTLIGKHYGKHRLFLNKKKTAEGSLSFLLTAVFALVFFVNPLSAVVTAILATLVEALPKVDDNLTIPMTVGIMLTIIS